MAPKEPKASRCFPALCSVLAKLQLQSLQGPFMRCKCISWIGAISLFITVAVSLVGIGRNNWSIQSGLGSGPTTAFVRHARDTSSRNFRFMWRKIRLPLARNVLPGRITLRGGVNAEDYDEDQLRQAEEYRIWLENVCDPGPNASDYDRLVPKAPRLA
jgi:hypothetical protein